MLPRSKKIFISVLLFLTLFNFKWVYADDENFILNFYKNHISVVDGNRCPMYPSCAHYASSAFEKHGFVRGFIMSCDRLVRCGRDEAAVSGRVVVNNHELIHDPVEANDFWWFKKDKKR